MEQAVQFLVKNIFEDYVEGLNNQDCKGGAVSFNDLTLNTTKINEEIDEEGTSPFKFDSGKVGMVSFEPTWFGGLNLKIDGIQISLSFNPLKAMKAGLTTYMKGDDTPPSTEAAKSRKPSKDAVARGISATPSNKPRIPAQNPSQNPATMMYGSGVVSGGQVFCEKHDSTDKRPKSHPASRNCASCKMDFQTNYVQFTYCPQCSGSEKKCMVCGDPTTARKIQQPEQNTGDAPSRSGGRHGTTSYDPPYRGGRDVAISYSTSNLQVNGNGTTHPPNETSPSFGRHFPHLRMTNGDPSMPSTQRTMPKNGRHTPVIASARSLKSSRRVPRDVQFDCGDDWMDRKSTTSFSSNGNDRNNSSWGLNHSVRRDDPPGESLFGAFTPVYNQNAPGRKNPYLSPEMRGRLESPPRQDKSRNIIYTKDHFDSNEKPSINERNHPRLRSGSASALTRDQDMWVSGKQNVAEMGLSALYAAFGTCNTRRLSR